MFHGIPRWVVAAGTVLIVGIPLVIALPEIVTIASKIRALSGENEAKALQELIARVELDKRRAEADAARTQALLNQANALLATANSSLARMQEEKAALERHLVVANTRQSIAQTEAAKAQAEASRAQAYRDNAQGTQTNLQTGVAIAGGVAAVLGTAYVANKFGVLPNGRPASEADFWNPPYKGGDKVVITAAGANIRECGDVKPSCPVLNVNDPLTKTSIVTIDHGPDIAPDGERWYRVYAQTKKKKYEGYLAASTFAAK